MKNSNWKIAVIVGLAALAAALGAVALIVGGRDRDPSDNLPDIIAPSVAPHTAAPLPTPTPTPEPTERPAPERVTFVGDSIMVAAESELTRLIPNIVVDAKVGRQLVEAMSILRRLESQGQLYETVVIGLGSNLPFTVEEGSEVLDFLGDRTIYWVNTYGRYLEWQDEVNATIAELAELYDNVTVIDWSSVAPEHPSWIRSDDGIHLTGDGTTGYAEFVAGEIGIDLPEEEEDAA